MEKDDRVDVIDLVKKNANIISNWNDVDKKAQITLLNADKMGYVKFW